MRFYKQHDRGPCGAAVNETGGEVYVRPEYVGSARWVAGFRLGDRSFIGLPSDTPAGAIEELFDQGRPCRALSGEFAKMRRELDRAALAQYAGEPRD